MEIIYNNSFELHYFSSNKLILITFNKGASRFVSNYFEDYTEAVIRVNSEFEIVGGHIISSNSEEELSFKGLKEEWKSVITKTCSKDIIFLYRNPTERIITGIIQEFATAVCSGQHAHFKFDFLLKNVLKDKPSGIITYKHILNHGTGFIYGIYNDDIMEGVRDNIIELFQDYLSELSITPITFTTHTHLYFCYLYFFISSKVIDENKFYLVNLSDKKINLKSILEKYELVSKNSNEKDDDKNSNKTLIDVYYKLLNYRIEPKYDIREIHRLIQQSILADTSAYKKLTEHPNNYKSET